MTRTRFIAARSWIALGAVALFGACGGGETTGPSTYPGPTNQNPLPGSSGRVPGDQSVAPGGSNTPGSTDPGTSPDPTQSGLPGPTGPTNGFAAHLRAGCDQLNSLYTGAGVINIGSVASTCGDLNPPPDDVIQILLGEPSLLPPQSGKTYNIRPSGSFGAGVIYPPDGEAEGHYSLAAGGSATIESGFIRFDPSSDGKTFSGSYQVTLKGGAVFSNTFHTDVCPPDGDPCQ